jgi:hypothetical protein
MPRHPWKKTRAFPQACFHCDHNPTLPRYAVSANSPLPGGVRLQPARNDSFAFATEPARKKGKGFRVKIDRTPAGKPALFHRTALFLPPPAPLLRSQDRSGTNTPYYPPSPHSPTCRLIS